MPSPTLDLPALSSSRGCCAPPGLQLFAAVQPALADDRHTGLQKRAYAVVAALLQSHPGLLRDGGGVPLDAVVRLLQDAFVTVSAAARRGRLQCLRILVGCLSRERDSHRAVLPSVLGEVMLCLRDSNAKVRGAAEAVLGAMAEWAAEGGDGAGLGADADTAAAATTVPPPTLSEVFRMVLGGLGAATPHMRSAAVSALALLLYNFSQRPVVAAMLPALTESTLVLAQVRKGAALCAPRVGVQQTACRRRPPSLLCCLAQEKSREVAAAVVGFCRVLASVTPPRELAPLVRPVVTALLVWGGETKNRIRTKIKGVLRRLARRVGLDAVAAHMPTADSPLIAYLRKMQVRRGGASHNGGGGKQLPSRRALRGGGGRLGPHVAAPMPPPLHPPHASSAAAPPCCYCRSAAHAAGRPRMLKLAAALVTAAAGRGRGRPLGA